MKTYKVTKYYHVKAVCLVEADNEDEALGLFIGQNAEVELIHENKEPEICEVEQ